MSAWETVRLGDVIDVFDHKRVPLSSAQRATRKGPFPYYGAQGVIDHIDDFIFDGRFILVPEDGENLRSRKLPVAYFAEGQFWVNNHAHIIKAKPGVAVDRFVQSAIEATSIAAWVTGAAQPKLSQANLREIPLRLPSFRDQQIVSAVLDAIDDLIENNRRRVEVLEEIAQAIYREWFVHFRYPGHENATLVESAVGPIPDGWRVAEVGEVVAAEKGLSYKGVYLTQYGLPMANLKCFRPGGGFRRDGTKPYSGPFKAKHEIHPGDLIVANTDLTQAGSVIGSPALVPRRGFESGGIISHHLFAIRCSEPALRGYIYEALRDRAFRDYARGVASGTTVLGLRPADLLAYHLMLPPAKLLDEFAGCAAGITALVEDLRDSAEVLSLTRDLLLPKLVTGQIDVSSLDLDGLVEDSVA